MIEFKMPSLGADMEAGTLVEWLVKPGNPVKRGDIIAVVDTQKGLIDIEVFDEGTISELVIKENEKVPVGTVMALIASGKEEGIKKEVIKPAKKVEEKIAMEKIVAAKAPHFIKASPLAKRIAAEKGIELNTIHGTGEDGAITKDDVEKAIVEKMAPKEEKKIATAENIRMAVAAAMSKSNREIPHYYLETKVDMSKALSWLAGANKQRSVKQRLLPVVLLIKAVAKALTELPDLNGYWENGLHQKQDINIGFVVSLRTGGVMIPAIHNADKKTVDELMTSLNDIIPRARAMKLRSSELSESTFTVTSLGEGNVETVYGVIYPPQVALAGFGSIIEQPWAESGMLDVRPVLTITLSADHRASDGATGSRFLMAVKNHLQKPEAL
ncbi:2-oxo acid dehydrogenase subunit E2 [Ginsengibacter hankyongi]|uniref:Dihydrolipoamide acetyltransferase component of pyruvate dehydrogenase complex n=1 Tax=Ginsengibacter hankyongi TaxID=2607284 RepID=A0A5J5ID52_9BACT|nr:dihydrolipoamide acetyltransferase family protein [Ginsengibacter hankyongi]KAA9035653.1 2-oxo acid dehydrogenase subunit E2 [Ginsengibacter hankyongi]